MGVGSSRRTWSLAPTGVDTLAAGSTPVATVSPQATAAFQRLMVRSEESKRAPQSIETDLYRNDLISAERRALTTERRGDIESWQANSTTARLGAELRTPEGEAMVKALRAASCGSSGPKPTAKHRRKVAIELRESKNIGSARVVPEAPLRSGDGGPMPRSVSARWVSRQPSKENRRNREHELPFRFREARRSGAPAP